MNTNLTKKNHQTSKNSIQSFIEFNKTDKGSKQHVEVIAAIKEKQPINSRQLAKITGIERTAVCRVLFNAVNCPDPLIKKFTKPCPLTGKKVSFYCLIDFEITEPGN